MNDANATTALETDDAVACDYGAPFRTTGAALDLFGGIVRLDPVLFAADGSYIGSQVGDVAPAVTPAPVAQEPAPAKRPRARRRDFAFVR